MTKYHDVKRSMLRTCTRQRNCSNVPTQRQRFTFDVHCVYHMLINVSLVNKTDIILV